VAQAADEAQTIERIRPAVDQIADEPEPVVCGSKAISSSRRSSACRLPCRSPIANVAMMPVLLVCHCPCITAASTARRRIDVLSPRVQRPTWFVRHAAGCHKKTGTNAGFLRAAGRRLSLLDLRLLEDHVLACLGIVFLHFQLIC